MTETSDAALPAAGRAAAGRVSTIEETADVERREDDGLVEYAATWERDGIKRAVIVDIILEPDELVDEYPPEVAVEYSAWRGPVEGPAEEMTGGTVADLFDADAEALAMMAVERARDRVAAVTDEDLHSVDFPDL